MVFTSCTPESNSAPVITIDNASPVTAVGGSVTLTGGVVAEAKLDEVKFYWVTETSESQIGEAITSFSSGVFTTSDDLNYNFRITIDGLTESGKIKLTATDKDNQTSSKSIDVTVEGGAVNFNEFTAILMGAQSNAAGSTLDADAGTVYKLADASSNQALIDILYYYGSTNKATFVAPNDETVNGGSSDFTWTQSWTTQNATKFGVSTMTSAEFDAITDADLAAITGLSASKATDLGVDDVLNFVTAGGKNGALKVTALTASNSGTITITVKIQK
jgi:hypothetical protein